MLVKSSPVHVAVAVSLVLCFVAPATAEAAVPAAHGIRVAVQPQQKDQWCWAGVGASIAAQQGVTVSQTRFCQLAHGESGSACANRPATLEGSRRAFAGLGFTSPGRVKTGPVPYGVIKTETAADRPLETRVGYRSGGGHAHLLYGYDTSGDWVYWGDPQPAGGRYNWSTYDYYAHNPSFSWTHTLTGVTR